MEERAPSVIRADTPQIPRYIAVVSLMLVTLGGASMLFSFFGKRYLIAPGWGFLLLSMGIAGLLYHAFYEKEFQFRRLYGALGGLLLLVGVGLRLMPVAKVVGGSFYPFGPMCLFLSLGFLLCFIRNEEDSILRTRAIYVLGIMGFANALAGAVGGMINENFLLSTGIIHLIVGLLFAAAYIGVEGASTTRGYWAARAIGLLGLAMFLLALGRSTLPYLWFNWGWSERPPVAFFLPSGLILMYLGAEYLILSVGICSDNKLVVMTRRELGSFFCSPIAYIVLIGMAVIGWLNFFVFLQGIFGSDLSPGGSAMPEPIVGRFLISFLALIPLIFLVPVITMRLLTEEKRSGTLEVLLTAPVNEWTIVLSKFLATLRVFMLCWYSWGIFFIALRIEGGKEFDYRPLITFIVALLCMGAGFVAMGLFFSSLSQHQILAAVFTFVAMLTLTILFILAMQFSELVWLNNIINYVTYVDLWIVSARGTIVPRYLIYHVSMAAFWLFLTTKVLEARKWG
jgi:ABC-type transport system involved in multi-copper enzyme maturation permease subunit